MKNQPYIVTKPGPIAGQYLKKGDSVELSSIDAQTYKAQGKIAEPVAKTSKKLTSGDTK